MKSHLTLQSWLTKITLVLALLLSASPASRAQIINVFLIGGQSNADGRANKGGLPSNLQGNQNNIRFEYGNSATSDSGLTVLKPGTSSDGGFGPEVTFGKTIGDYLIPQGQSTAILKFAVGGTDLYSDWKAGGTATTAGDGATYAAFQSTIATGLLNLHNAFPNATLLISGMLWVQGETDIDNTSSGVAPTAVSNYAANLTALINDIRLTYNSPNLPFLFSQISKNQTVYSTPTDPDYQNYLTLRAQQQLVANTVANTYLINTDGSQFTTTNPISGPGLHYDANGQQALGIAFANQMELLIVPEPSSLLLILGGAFLLGGRRRLLAQR